MTFLSFLLPTVLFSGSAKMSGTLEPLVTLQKLEREDITKHVLGQEHK